MRPFRSRTNRQRSRSCSKNDGCTNGLYTLCSYFILVVVWLIRGIVYLVAEHYSVLIPVLNTKSNISCTIKNRGYFGYLRWKGGPSEYAYMEDVPRHAHFMLGDYVVTSGYSAVFPPGVLVGKVLHVFNSADGLSYRVQLKLSTDFAKLRDVCVIDDAPMRERLELMRAAQDSIKPD